MVGVDDEVFVNRAAQVAHVLAALLRDTHVRARCRRARRVAVTGQGRRTPGRGAVIALLIAA